MPDCYKKWIKAIKFISEVFHIFLEEDGGFLKQSERVKLLI